jgi:protoporphyrinogen oxidase
MKVGIVGGGMMGACLGYYLSREGVQVEIFEASPTLGGLAGPINLEPGVAVDRYYHTILSSDSYLIALCEELGIADHLRFQETRTGFFTPKGIYSMNNVVDFLRFPPLSWVDRFRLGVTILAAQLIKDWHALEGISVEAWLKRWSGEGAFQNLWKPMLKAKFDGSFAETPATYMWSRLVRMKSARGGASQKEMAGHLIGGYETLANALTERILAAGGIIHLQTPVQEIHIERGRATGLQVQGKLHAFDAVVATLPVPHFRRMIPAANPDYQEFLGLTTYLGVICPLLALDRPLTDFWTLNIADDRMPFTGVIETTAYIDPKYVGGYHLVYLPKYTQPDGDWLKVPDEEIRRVWLETLEQMFPDFDRAWIRHFRIHRERFVEPIHPLNGFQQIPDIRTPVENLYLATTAQIYPALTNVESISRHARKTADLMIEARRASVPGLDLAPVGESAA